MSQPPIKLEPKRLLDAVLDEYYPDGRQPAPPPEIDFAKLTKARDSEPYVIKYTGGEVPCFYPASVDEWRTFFEGFGIPLNSISVNGHNIPLIVSADLPRDGAFIVSGDSGKVVEIDLGKPQLIDGKTREWCLEQYIKIQRLDYGGAMTPAQREVAREMWATQLRVKVSASEAERKAREVSVVVDLEDL